ncbi:hypothetical protein [Phenylobacterium sp. SCN 70-31]|uniref:hypothetical protein n=1 Tax=Phenylobacterium sp. SCN 70-31 TaxID=1660129 RepID=UPI00086CE46A|nr:hypothetical protein [Phenylobacterium sp. SCN 70-31]ODT88242.1 MAG: hypothetical protein ABS78_08365 [Phenylobacterium sp. SCN 70-31]
MLRFATVLLVAAVGLNGCGAAAPRGAIESASRLLAAALNGDRAAFEAQIDRAAVREDVRRQMAAVAKATVLDVDGGPSEFALDRMISPEKVRVVDRLGAAVTSAPTPQQVAPLMRRVDESRACLKDSTADGDCLLTFAKGRDHWRLVGMRAMDLTVQVDGD